MTTKAAKRTKLLVEYNNTDITKELEKFLMDWSYTDNLSGEIDNINIKLEDRDDLWLADWFPSKGSTIAPTLLRGFWFGNYDYSTDLGVFELDDIKGEKSVINLNALATSENSSLRGEEKCAAWEKIYLKTVISEIASKNGMSLVWESSENPKKDRYEQDNETDLAFIHKLCKDAGLCLKLSSNKIVVLDEADYEAQPAKGDINRIPGFTDPIQIKKYSFSSTLTDTYKACRVTHHDSTKKKNIEATFTAPNAPKVGRTLVIKQEVDSKEEALKLAKKKLHEKNKEATKITLEVFTTTHIYAGDTFNLVGFGTLNGKYIVTQIVYNPKTITLQVRRCLEGY